MEWNSVQCGLCVVQWKRVERRPTRRRRKALRRIKISISHVHANTKWNEMHFCIISYHTLKLTTYFKFKFENFKYDLLYTSSEISELSWVKMRKCTQNFQFPSRRCIYSFHAFKVSCPNLPLTNSFSNTRNRKWKIIEIWIFKKHFSLSLHLYRCCCTRAKKVPVWIGKKGENMSIRLIENSKHKVKREIKSKLFEHPTKWRVEFFWVEISRVREWNLSIFRRKVNLMNKI